MLANIPSPTMPLPQSLVCDLPLPAANSFNLYLRLCCDRHRQTFVSRQYAAYPFRLSNVFRLDSADLARAYLYIMNTSPGVMAGDLHRIFVQLEANTKLYLTDQSATKVHTMPTTDAIAQVSYTFNVGAGAQLEFLPEPLILYKNSTLEQTTQVTLHPTAQLFLSELVVPGRLARHEIYQFHAYLSRLQVLSLDGELIFGDAMLLEGNLNPFKQHALFSALPAIANIVAVLPQLDLQAFVTALEKFAIADPLSFAVGHSCLPNCNGLLIRAMSDNVNTLKTYTQYALNCVRQLGGQTPLPHIPK
jgi:urease accessory protein